MIYQEPEYSLTYWEAGHYMPPRRNKRYSPYKFAPSSWEIDQMVWSTPQARGFKHAYFHEWPMIGRDGKDYSTESVFTDIYGELGVDWDWAQLNFHQKDEPPYTAIYTHDLIWKFILNFKYEHLERKWLHHSHHIPRPLYFAEYELKDEWVKVRQITKQ